MVAPLVAEAYVSDHHGLDMAFEELKETYTEGDAIRTPGRLPHSGFT